MEFDFEGIQFVDRLFDDVDELAGSEYDLRGPVGFPPQRVDLPVGRRRSHRAERQREDMYRLFTEGERTVSDYYNAERDYNEMVRQYHDSLIRHRRSMLRLNTAVGQRLLP